MSSVVIALMQRIKSSQGKTHSAPQGGVLNRLESIADPVWNELAKRAAVLRSAGDGPLSREAAERLAHRLNVHTSTVYRWRRKLQDAGLLTGLKGSQRGFPDGTSRLTDYQDRVLQEVIAKHIRRPALVRIVDLVEEVLRVCSSNKITPPSRRTITRRWRQALVAHHADRQQPGRFLVDRPLDVVQIDHTVSDIFVVDELYREPIGRPYLTVALDVATRSILAVVLSFKAPSAATVALCLARMATPKDRWIEQLGLESSWPMTGMPRCIHLDNAPEFHSKALQRGCAEFGVEIVHRPAGRPHFGGHIERSIGTLMRRFESLPGATGPSTRDRKRRQPENRAVMTLPELERWLIIEIADRYHHREHKGLHGATPYGVWTADPPKPLEPARRQALAWAFLPAVSRTVRRDGIHFSRILYWHSLFSQWAITSEVVTVHYDPRDLSRLFVVGKKGVMVEATYGDITHPPVSIWECDAAAAHLRRLGRTALSEARLFAAIEAQRDIVQKAASSTRRARLQQARQPEHRNQSGDSSVNPDDEHRDSVTDDLGCDDYAGEIWST